MGFFDVLCRERGWSRSFALRELIRAQVGLEAEPVREDFDIPSAQVVALLQDRIDQVPAGPKWTDITMHPAVHLESRAPELPPGWTGTPGGWALSPKGVQTWTGEHDADGNPLVED